MKWLHDLLTDREGLADTGRVLAPVVVGTMCYMAVSHPETYNPQTFGTGIGAVLVGLAGYLFGDSRRPPGG